MERTREIRLQKGSIEFVCPQTARWNAMLRPNILYFIWLKFVLSLKTISRFSTTQVPLYLSDDLERLQKRALWELSEANLESLLDRIESLIKKLFDEFVNENLHKLHKLLPPLNIPSREARRERKFRLAKCKTRRFQNCFIKCKAMNCCN